MVSFKKFFSHPFFLLSIIVLAGVLLRLCVAWHAGYQFDVDTNQGWGKTVVLNGWLTSYSSQVDGTMVPNYPPFSLFIFGIATKVYQIFSPDVENGTMLFRYLIKTPAMLADIIIGIIFFFVFYRLKRPKAGLGAAAVFLFNPAVWFDSAVWGQTDVLFSFFILVSVLMFVRNAQLYGGIFAALALFTKVQAIIFAPLLGLVSILQIKRFYRSIIGLLIVISALSLPFIFSGSGIQLWYVFSSSVGFYARVSQNAYNFWWAMYLDAANDLNDSDMFAFGLSYYRAGLITMLLLYVVILARFILTWLRAKSESVRCEAIFAAATLCSLSFFLFNTQMHERYLFPFLIFGLPLPFFRKQYSVPYAVISFCIFFNIVGVLPYTEFDMFFFRVFPAWDAFIASLTLFCFCVMFWQAMKTSLSPAKLRRPSLWQRVNVRYVYICKRFMR